MRKKTWRAQLRKQMLSQRKAKMASARFCLKMVKFYYEMNNLPAVKYWEGEYHRIIAEAGAISRIVAA